MALELDFEEVDNQRVLNAIFGEGGECYVVLVHVHADDRPRVLLVSNGLFSVGDVDVHLCVVFVEQVFRSPNLPLVAFECSLGNVEVCVVTVEDALNVLVGLRADAERHVTVDVRSPFENTALRLTMCYTRAQMFIQIQGEYW